MKKNILTIVFILIGFLNSIAQEYYNITLDFKGMKTDKGSLYVAVYNTEKDFLKKPIKGTIVTIKEKKARVIFKNIISGMYAVSAFHDINENNKMDTNFIGIPKEPIGISNDAKGFIGPPRYKDAKFKVTKNVLLTINVK